MKQPPNETPQAQAARLARQERQAVALRENLRRRKEQARDRQGRGAAPEPAKGEPLEPST